MHRLLYIYVYITLRAGPRPKKPQNKLSGQVITVIVLCD